MVGYDLWILVLFRRNFIYQVCVLLTGWSPYHHMWYISVYWCGCVHLCASSNHTSIFHQKDSKNYLLFCCAISHSKNYTLVFEWNFPFITDEIYPTHLHKCPRWPVLEISLRRGAIRLLDRLWEHVCRWTWHFWWGEPDRTIPGVARMKHGFVQWPDRVAISRRGRGIANPSVFAHFVLIPSLKGAVFITNT